MLVPMRFSSALLLVALVACGSATKQAARHVIVEGPVLLTDENGVELLTSEEKRVAACASRCSDLRAQGEQLASCWIVRGSDELSKRFVSKNFFVCNFTRT
jgi:hypothetical protein